MILRFLLSFILSLPQGIPFPGPGTPSGAVSNIVKVQSLAFKQAGASGAYSGTVTSTGAGHLLTVVEFDYAANPSAPSLVTDTNGDTWTQACTFNNPGLVTFF